jgi:hypothetical protein
MTAMSGSSGYWCPDALIGKAESSDRRRQEGSRSPECLRGTERIFELDRRFEYAPCEVVTSGLTENKVDFRTRSWEFRFKTRQSQDITIRTLGIGVLGRTDRLTSPIKFNPPLAGNIFATKPSSFELLDSHSTLYSIGPCLNYT